MTVIILTRRRCQPASSSSWSHYPFNRCGIIVSPIFWFYSFATLFPYRFLFFLKLFKYMNILHRSDFVPHFYLVFISLPFGGNLSIYTDPYTASYAAARARAPGILSFSAFAWAKCERSSSYYASATESSRTTNLCAREMRVWPQITHFCHDYDFYQCRRSSAQLIVRRGTETKLSMFTWSWNSNLIMTKIVCERSANCPDGRWSICVCLTMRNKL